MSENSQIGWALPGLDLPPRREAVLRLVQRGLSNLEIEISLGICQRGVEKHIELLRGMGFDIPLYRWTRSGHQSRVEAGRRNIMKRWHQKVAA